MRILRTHTLNQSKFPPPPNTHSPLKIIFKSTVQATTFPLVFTIKPFFSPKMFDLIIKDKKNVPLVELNLWQAAKWLNFLQTSGAPGVFPSVAVSHHPPGRSCCPCADVPCYNWAAFSRNVSSDTTLLTIKENEAETSQGTPRFKANLQGDEQEAYFPYYNSSFKLQKFHWRLFPQQMSLSPV